MIDNINLQIHDFVSDFDTLINDSNLPIGVLHYILKDYTNNIEKNYIGYLNSYYLAHPETEEIHFVDDTEETDEVK